MIIRLLSVIILSGLSLVLSAQIRNDTVYLPADTFPFETKISVKKGEVYQISASGKWQDASFEPSDANGFKGFTAPMFFGMLLKPLPSQHYMMLCGRVKTFKFPIGNEASVEMKRDGVLELFANDAKGFFDNNSGTLTVVIKQLNQIGN